MEDIKYKNISEYPVSHPTPPDPIDEDKLRYILDTELVNWKIIQSPLPEDTLKLRRELFREYIFKSFKDVISFINELAKACDVIQHHPRWENSWKNLKVYLTTWDSKHIITYKDVISARMMDNIFESKFKPPNENITYISPNDSTNLANRVKRHLINNEIEDAAQIAFDYITRPKGFEVNDLFAKFIGEYHILKEFKEGNKSQKEITERIMLTGNALEQVIEALYPKPKVYFSYAWGGEKEVIVNELYKVLLTIEKYEVIRDKVNLGYKGLITDFMKLIGKGNIVIVALSNKYLRSEYCMFELYELYRNSKLNPNILINKIFPIRAEEIDINSIEGKEEIYEYWENEKKRWGKHLEKRKKDHKRYERVNKINQTIGELLDFLDDINVKSLELLTTNNYEEIRHSIDERIEKIITTTNNV